MDPNPTKYPILSYLSRLPTFVTKPKSSEFDLENPPPPSPSHDEDPIYAQLQSDLRSRMPHLNDPDLIQSMKQAVSNVSQTRSVLKLLGERPDHEAVDTARLRILQIEESLAKKVDEKQPEGVDVELEAERDKEIYRAVVKLDEMHESYEKLLREAEDKLEKLYRNASEKQKGRDVIVEEEEEEEEVNEEVVEILRLGEKGPERVDLSARSLRVIPEAFGRLSGLVSLDLSENELKVLPDSIAGLERLEELYLSSNLLESLPDSIGLLFNLRMLNVSSNKLTALPDSISHCRSLVELDASYNSLMYLPTNIGYELVSLTKLSVQYNKLRSLPSSICEMSSLCFLDVHFNELHGLPNAIGRLINLEILNLSSNFSDLIDLPQTFGDMMNLRELDLSNNQIHTLPDTFGQLDKLTKLNLDQNPMVIPPVEVVNKGTEAVKEFMAKRWLDILVEEEQKLRAEENDQAETGWLKRSTTMLTRSTSALTSWASTVSENVTEYLGVKAPADPYLNQQL